MREWRGNGWEWAEKKGKPSGKGKWVNKKRVKWVRSGKQRAAGQRAENVAYFRAETEAEAEAIKANEQKSVRWPKGGVGGGVGGSTRNWGRF